MADARNAQAEAQAHLERGYVARVLEPSPPAVDDGALFADDPAAIGQTDGSAAVTPTSAGSATWDGLAKSDPAIAAYARDHWLGNWRRVGPVPASYVATRNDLHRLAYTVVANARKQANGKFGLRYTHGGFGTPFYGDDTQARIAGTEVVLQQGDHVQAVPITTLAAAGELLGVAPNEDQREHDTIEMGDIHRQLQIDPAAAAFVADWFGFGWSVLEELRLTPGAEDVGRTQLWPGHFDPACELGVYREEGNTRATYGCSPGDEAHTEPYLYVASWGEIDRSIPYWNDSSFSGASLPYAELLAAEDQRATALAFFREGYRLMTS